MYEFDLVLLLLQQMCVFLVIAWLMSKTRLFIPLMQVTVRLPHKLLCYVTFSISALWGPIFGLYRRLYRQHPRHRRRDGRPARRPGGRRAGGADRRTAPLLAGGMTALSCMVSTIVEGATGRSGAQRAGQTRPAGQSL